MAFPVDILTNVDYESLELAAEEYMSQLPYRNTEYFSLSDSKQIEIGLCNVSFVPLYGTDTEKKLLALFSPDDSNTVVGLYLLDQWWGVEDILKTAEPSKTGLIKVSTLGERIVLYVLNRIVLRNEKSNENVFFLCHCEHEAAKILWKDGEAIGFYSFKPKGSLCRNFVTQCYHLPVMDTIFVRKCHRGKGHGVKILEDFVGSFRNEYIGLKFPLSEAMYKVCEKYLSIYPADKELLWEVEKIGSPFQRTLIANRLQKLKLTEKDQIVSKLNFEDDATAPMEIELTKVQETSEYTVEILEETIIDITKEVDDITVTRRGRGSNLKHRAIRENSEERLSENIFRVEDIEAGVESSTEMADMENLNTFSVKESDMVLRSSVDTVTATVTNFAELRESQKEEAEEIEKDIVTATLEGTPVTHLTTAGEIKSQRGSKVECEMVIREYTVEIQGATIGSTDQSQLQSVVDVEIVKMSTGTEEEKNENLEKNKEVDEDESVCEAEKEDEPKEEKTVSETEVAEQSETHAKSAEKEHWDVEITENKERAEDEAMAESGMDLIEENRDDSIGQEKSEAEDEDTVLQQSVEVKDQTEMEADSVTEVLSTEDILCDQPKQNEAETEVSKPNEMITNKDTLSEKSSKNKLGPDEAEQVFTKSKLPQKRTSALTPSRRSKRLRHQPAEKDLKTTKSVKTVQQRYKHHSKAMMQDNDTEQSADEPEHDVSEVIEKIQEAQFEGAEAESEVEEYKEKDMLTVETVSTMDVEITQVEETVFPEVSELVEREEADEEEAPQQSSVEPPEIQESKKTPDEDEETVENSTVILTLSEAKVVIVDLHKISPKEAGDNHGETDIHEQEEMKHTMSSEQQATEKNMRKEEQDGTLDTKPMEEPACTTTTEGYDVAADTNRTLEQSATYKDQEGEPESETREVVLLSQVEKPEKTDTEQAKEDKQDSYEADKLFPKQSKQTQKKGSIDTPSRFTELKDQPVGPVTGCLRSTLKPVKVTPVRRSTHRKAVIQQVESVEPHAKHRTDENPKTDEVIAKDVSPEENEMANTNVDETASVECGSSELLKPAEIDNKEKEPQITKVAGEIPEAEEDVTAKRVEDIKKMENKEANLAGQTDSDIEMSSLAQEVHVQEEEVPISTERHLRCRTIRVQTPLVNKSRCVQKQKAEADVEHQEKHTVVRKKETETILMTKERDDEIDQDVNKIENKEEHLAELEPVEEPNMSRNEYEKTSAITEETVNVCIPFVITETSLESLDEMVNKNIEETAVPEISELPLRVETDDQEKEFQIFDGPEEKVSLVETGNEVENDDGTPVIKLQRATVVLVDLSKLSQNTKEEGEASEDLTHFQTEEKLELDEPDKSEQDLSNLASEEEEQQEEILQTQEDTEKTPEEEKMEEENTAEELNKLAKQDMTFEEQKPTKDLATMPAEGSLVESNKTENNQTEDEGVSSLAQENAVQENLEEEAPVSTQRSLRKRTIRVQSSPRRKSRRIQKQVAEVSEDKTEIVLITEKEADDVDQGVEIDDKEKTPQTSTVDGTEKVIPLVEAEPEDDVAEKGVEEINKMENKETNLSLTKETVEEATEVGEEASLEQRQNEPLDKNDKKTAKTETSMDIDPVVGKEQTYLLGGTTIQIEEKVSQVSLVEAEPDEEVKKDDGTPVMQLQKATVVLVDLIKLSQNTEKESDTPEVLIHSHTEEKLEQDKLDNSEYQLCNLTSEEEEQQELQKEEDTEKVEEQNEPNEQDMTFEGQKPTEDLEGQNDLIETEIVEAYRAVDEDVEEAVKSGEHPEKTTTMADKSNIIQEAEKDHNITLKEKQTDSDIEMSGLAQEASETDQEVLEEEASVSTERSLRHRTIKIQSPPRRKSRRLQKQEAEAFEDKARNIPIRGKVVKQMQETEKKLQLDEPDKSEQGLSNLASEEEEQQEEILQTQEDTEKTPEEEKMEEENTAEEPNKLDKQDITFEEQKPTEDLATMPAEGGLVESNKIENNQTEDEGVSSLAQENAVQENLEEEAPVSTQRSLRQRIIRVQSSRRRKSGRIQKQVAEVSEDKTEIVLITEKEADDVNQGVEIDDKEKTPQTSTVDGTEKVIPLVEAEPEDDVAEKGVEEINKMENKGTNLSLTKETGEEATEVGEEASLEQRQNEPLDKNDKKTAETETSMDINPVVGKEQTYLLGGTTIQIEEKVSQVSLVEPEPGEEVEKDDGTPVMKLQKATVVLADLIKLSQNTEEESDTPEVLIHSHTEEKLEQDKPDNSEYQLCNLASEEEEQQEQLQKEKDTEKTPEKDKMYKENTVEEQNNPNEQDMTFEGQKPTEDLEGQNDLIATEIVEGYRAVDEDVEEAVKSGEHPEKTTTMADKTNIIQEAEKDHNITLKEKQTDNDIEMSGLAQEAPETDQEVLEEEASVSTERSLRRRAIKLQSPPRKKSRRLQKQEADVFEDKTRNIPIRGKIVEEIQETLKKSTVEATEVMPFVEAGPEDDVAEKGVEEINKMENKETNLAVTKETDEETREVGEEANLEQQQNEPLVKNDKETTKTEKTMEIVPVVGKEQTYLVGGTTIQIEEKVSQVSLVEAEPDEEVEKDDGSLVMQLQKATVVLVDLIKLSQNTEGESNTPEVLIHSHTEEKLEQDKLDNSEYQLCNLTSEEEEQQEQLQKEEDTEKTPEKDKMDEENTVEERNETNEQDMTFEGQKPTEDLEGQNDLITTEIVEVYRAVDEDVEEAVKSGEHPEKTTTMADKTNIIQEAEKDHNITLKEKQTDNDIEMSGLAQEAPETDQEVLEEEASVSTERSLRRRTIKIQSPPRRKSRRLQKQEAEVFEDKRRNVPVRGKVVEEMLEEGSKIDDKEKTQSTVEATEVIPLLKADHEENVIKEGFENTVMENKKTNLAVTKDTEPLVKNDKETTESEKPMEIDPVVGKEQTYTVGGTTIQIEEKVSQVSLVEAEPDEEVERDDGTPVIQLQIDPVVSNEQTYAEGGTTIQIEEKFLQVESTETNQSDNERITKRSLRLSGKSVTATQKTRKSTCLHKVELEQVKDTNMSRNEHEEISATTEETVNVCMPVITVESNLESLDEMANTNVEETTAVEPETGEEINDKEEASQIVEEVPPREAEPDEEAEKDDGTPVILQKDTLLLVNKLSQNTEEQADTPEVLTHFHTEEQLELHEPDKSEYQLCDLTSEEDIQDMAVEGQKPTDDLVGENDVKERENVEEYNVVIDEDVEECVSSGEHPKATTMEDNTNIIQETENNQDIYLKDKQMDSDVEMSSLRQEAPETVQEILEEEASVSTERSLRRRTIKIQSPPIRKSRRVQRQEAEVFEGKTGTVLLTGKGDEEVHKEGAEIDKEEMLQKSTVEAIENISLTEGDPDENVIEIRYEEINNMENKETNLRNEATPEMKRDEVNLEQQEIELSVENEKETAETEKPTGMDEVSVVNKEKTYVLEETTIQAEEEISQMENSESNENKSEMTKRRSLRISARSVTSTQKTRTSAHLQKAKLEPMKEAEMSRDEEASSMTAKTVNVCLPVTIETNVENLDEDGDMVSESKNVGTTSDEQDIDISNDKGKVDEALPEISTDVEENETMTLIKIPENEILVEMDKTQRNVEGGVQDEDKHKKTSQEKNDKEQEEAVSLGENVGETNLTNEFQTTAVEGKIALESSEQEAAFITRSLRYRTVTVQYTPRSKSKRFHRQELESERETDSLNVPTGKENEPLIAEDNTSEFENLETKEGEGVIQTNTDGKSEKSETKDDTKEEGSEILFEIVESNSGSQVNTEQDKTQEENLEREDMPVRNEQEEEEVSSVQKEANPLQEGENEGATEGVQGSSVDLEETAVERRTLRKRMTVETATPRKSKRLRKQEHDDDSEQVKEADMCQTDSAEVTFTEDSVELRSDAAAADFKGSNLAEEILQKIQKNAQGTKSDGDCNVHKDTEPDAGESQEEQKQSRLNKTQTDEDKEEVMTDEIVEEVIEQHVDLESSTNEGLTLALEVEETSDQEENKADEENRVVMEAPKEIFRSAEKYEKGEEEISDDDEKGLAIGEHVLQSSSTTASTRRKSMRLQMHESKKKTKEDESNSESEVQQTVKQIHQRKRKAITDSTSARRSKRHVRARIV